MTKRKAHRIILIVGTLFWLLVLLVSGTECWWLLTPAAAKQFTSIQLGHTFIVWAAAMAVSLVGTGAAIRGLLRGRGN